MNPLLKHEQKRENANLWRDSIGLDLWRNIT